MERLISSPLLPRSPLASRRSAALSSSPPPRSASAASFPFTPPLPSPLLLSKLHLSPPPLPAASASTSSTNPTSDDDTAQVKNFGFTDNSRRQVAWAAGVALAAAAVVAVVQPALASAFHPAAKAATTRSIFKSELLGSAWTGFLAGCLHTLSGPDHLAALAPLSIGRSRVESAAVGALWGCGHDAGQVIFGLLFLTLKDRLHIEVIRTWGTRVVGLTLLIIGALGIREASETPAPCVAALGADGSGGDPSSFPLDAAMPRTKKKITFATFATGIVHGLQPDALVMVLPALALPSRVAGAAFLGMFLVGTVVAMGSYTVLIGSCTEALRDRVPRITEKLTWAASLVAISMGIAILISQSLGFSLY